MPIYMDRHDIAGVTAKDVAEAHQMDLKVQDKYGCKALTYWFDEERGTAFCLIDANNRESVEAMHNDAHGLIPNQIINVDSSLVEAFLGRIEDPKPAIDGISSGHVIIDEPAFRAVMIAEFKKSILAAEGNSAGHIQKILKRCSTIIQKITRQHQGRKVDRNMNGYVASFRSVTNAVHCSLEIQKHFNELNRKKSGISIQPSVGISAGDPVTHEKNLFGEVVLSAERLSYIAAGGAVMVSPVVREVYKKENLGIFPDDDELMPLHPGDEDFLSRFMNTIEKNWNSDNFSIDSLCMQAGVSRAQLYRKTLALTGQSASVFLRSYRLDKALELLENKQGNITEIAFATGFSNPSYFSKCFHKHFGVLPSEYTNRLT